MKIRLRVAIIHRVESSARRGLNLPLLEERQLLAKEEILRSQGTAGMRREESQSDQVEHDQGQRPKAVCNDPENR